MPIVATALLLSLCSILAHGQFYRPPVNPNNLPAQGAMLPVPVLSPYGTANNSTQLVRDSTFVNQPKVFNDRITVSQQQTQQGFRNYVNNIATGLNPQNLSPEGYMKTPVNNRAQNAQYVAAKWGASAKQLDTVKNEPFTDSPTIMPTYVPNQQGPLPTDAEILQQIPQVSLTQFGQAIGVPLFQRYQASAVGQSQQLVGTVVNSAQQTATAPLTPEVINAIELEVVEKTLMNGFDSILTPYTRQTADDPLVKLLFLTTDALAWQKLDWIDPPQAAVGIARQQQQDKLRAAETCLAFNNRLPNCPVSPTLAPTPPPPLAAPPTLNKWGVYECVRVSNIAASCILPPPFNINTCPLNGQQWDGIYKFVGFKTRDADYLVDGIQTWPVWAKPANTETINNIYLSKSRFWGPNNGDQYRKVPIGGTWASFVPNTVNFEDLDPLFTPYIFTANIDGPNTCNNTDFTSFPQCASNSPQWVAGVQSPFSCSPSLPNRQIRIQEFCGAKVPLTIVPVACPSRLVVNIPRENRGQLKETPF